MAANLELLVLNKIIGTGDYHTVQKLRITEEFFGESFYKEIFRFIRDWFHHSHTAGQVPSFQIVKDNFPNFSWADQADHLSSLCSHLRTAKMRVEILQLADKLAREADYNPQLAIESLREASATLSSAHDITEDLLLSDSYAQLRRDYDLVASGKGVTGVPWPWEILNKDTQGMHRGDFYVIYGRPKSMKTWVGMTIAVHAYQEANARVLVYSMEMKPIRVLRRCAALLAKIDYTGLLQGTLNPIDRDKFFGILHQLKEEDHTYMDARGHSPALLVTGRGKGDKSAGGVSSLQAKIREFQPDLVIVDGMYLMRDDRGNIRTIDWKAVAHISQDLKATAQDMDVPLIGITQAKRGASKDAAAADLDELAYADAIGQDTDLAIRVQAREDPATKENEIILGFPGTRESKLNAFSIHGTPATDFSFKSEVVTPTTPPASGPQQGKSSSSNNNGAGRAAPASLPNYNQLGQGRR